MRYALAFTVVFALAAPAPARAAGELFTLAGVGTGRLADGPLRDGMSAFAEDRTDPATLDEHVRILRVAPDGGAYQAAWPARILASPAPCTRCDGATGSARPTSGAGVRCSGA